MNPGDKESFQLNIKHTQDNLIHDGVKVVGFYKIVKRLYNFVCAIIRYNMSNKERLFRQWLTQPLVFNLQCKLWIQVL